MRLSRYLWNCCQLIPRLRYLCCRPYRYPLTNCDQVNVQNKPRSIVTWNLQGLFFFMNPEKHQSILNEVSLLQTDIICLQEVFDNQLKESLIETMSETHPYYLLGTIDKKYCVGEDSGLLILSKYPIQFVKETLLPEAVIPDCFANKSILYFCVGDLNLCTCHLQSSNMRNAQCISAKQIQQIVEDSPFPNLIVTGDLNNNLGHVYLRQERTNSEPTWNNDILDYIVPINIPWLSMSTYVSQRSIEGVTDHKALFAVFEDIYPKKNE